MHRILSAQTAMRPENENLNVFITKRICISFVFSIGFFTLILGFLLGRFVADRDHIIKQIQNSEEIIVVNQLHVIKAKLLTTSRNLTEYQHASLYSEKIREMFLKCNKENDLIIDEKRLDDYIEELIDKSVHLLLNCFIELDHFMNKIND